MKAEGGRDQPSTLLNSVVMSQRSSFLACQQHSNQSRPHPPPPNPVPPPPPAPRGHISLVSPSSQATTQSPLLVLPRLPAVSRYNPALPPIPRPLLCGHPPCSPSPPASLASNTSRALTTHHPHPSLNFRFKGPPPSGCHVGPRGSPRSRGANRTPGLPPPAAPRESQLASGPLCPTAWWRNKQGTSLIPLFPCCPQAIHPSISTVRMCPPCSKSGGAGGFPTALLPHCVVLYILGEGAVNMQVR